MTLKSKRDGITKNPRLARIFVPAGPRANLAERAPVFICKTNLSELNTTATSVKCPFRSGVCNRVTVAPYVIILSTSLLDPKNLHASTTLPSGSEPKFRLAREGHQSANNLVRGYGMVRRMSSRQRTKSYRILSESWWASSSRVVATDSIYG